jgi:hypothetical protein
MTESSRTLPLNHRERSTKWADGADGKRTSEGFSMCKHGRARIVLDEGSERTQ